ncbi:MAG: glycosyltransferase family 4 protein [Propioniciclava sp.]
MTDRPTTRMALWIVPVSGLGGVARHVLDVARTGIPGWRLVIACPPGPLAEALRHQRAAVLPAPLGPEAGLSRTVTTVRALARSLRPQIIHSHLAYADIALALALPTTPAARVSTEHGIAPVDDVYHASRLTSDAMRAAHTLRVRRFDHLIAVSESTREVMIERWRPRVPITVNLNGIDPTIVAASPPGDQLHVASLSRLSPEKRIPELLAAFALVRRTHPGARLTVAGVGPERAAIRAVAERLGLTDAVTFPGHVPAEDLLSTADVVVQLSVWENCSYALLDACAAGLGVVATPVGGNSEILPRSSLVAADDHAAIAELITTQRDPGRRPGLRPGWPTVAAMSQTIAQVYAEVAP